MPYIAESFIARWKQSSASERANYALFLSELCDLIGVPRPDPSTSHEDANTYVIDKAVVFKELDGSSTTNFIDLYRRNCFVLEAKQGSNPQSVLPANYPSGRAQVKARNGCAWHARVGRGHVGGARAGRALCQGTSALLH